MNIHVFFNEGHRNLFEKYFRSTLEDDFQIVEHYLGESGATNFSTEDFKNIIYQKVKIVNDSIIPQERNNPYFIVSDVDIQFFGKIGPLIEKEMRSKDVVFQSEFGDQIINSGFIAMKSVPSVIALWKRVEDAMALALQSPDFMNEQALLNLYLATPPADLKWAVFDNSIWAYSNQALRYRHRAFKSIVLHHANAAFQEGTNSALEAKIKQLDEVRVIKSLPWVVRFALSFYRYLKRRIISGFKK